MDTTADWLSLCSLIVGSLALIFAWRAWRTSQCQLDEMKSQFITHKRLEGHHFRYRDGIDINKDFLSGALGDMMREKVLQGEMTQEEYDTDAEEFKKMGDLAIESLGYIVSYYKTEFPDEFM